MILLYYTKENNALNDLLEKQFVYNASQNIIEV